MPGTTIRDHSRRFEFGKNWRRFLATVDQQAIEESEAALLQMLGTRDLGSASFLDVGSGSGLSSLAAYRLGAHVTSFDYDPISVQCTNRLRESFANKDARWTVFQGSILDAEAVARLGRHDFVYSWGVLHHTGHMNLALEHAAALVRPGGTLFIAIYNDQGVISRYWRAVKRTWVSAPLLRVPIVLLHVPYLVGLRWLVRRLFARGRLERGMRLWYDMVDWLGGYPFEVAKPETIIDFHLRRGFQLVRLRTCGGRHGCNEFVFRREETLAVPGR